MLEALEWYLSELQNEAQGVREAIADLKKEMAGDQVAGGPDQETPATRRRERAPRGAQEPKASPRRRRRLPKQARGPEGPEEPST